MLSVGDYFPTFSCQACDGNTPDDLKEVNSATCEGKWKVFLFYPKDFTVLCPTELVEFGRNVKEFADRETVIFGGSTDNEYCHMAWRNSLPELKDLPYPLLSANRLASDLGILEANEHICYRATFIVDPDEVIQWASCYNFRCGRSAPEVLRVLDAIQSNEFCACNWQKGDGYLTV